MFMICMTLKVTNRNLEINSMFDQEPVELLKDKSDVMKGGGSGDDASSRVLASLESETRRLLDCY